jgi:hypothetical protein
VSPSFDVNLTTFGVGVVCFRCVSCFVAVSVSTVELFVSSNYILENYKETNKGKAIAMLVEALCYTPEGRGIESR